MTEDPLAPILRLPGVEEALTEARRAVDTLLGHRVLRRRSAEVSAEAGLRCARASAALAGHHLALADLRIGTTDDIVRGAVRVSTGLGALVDVVDRAPLQAIARLHVLAARGIDDEADLGRPSDEPNAAPRLARLAELIAGRKTSSALLLSAVVHGELLALQAFGMANDLVARGAARLLLIARGLDPKAVSCPDVGHLELATDYLAAAQAYRQGDVGTWVLHCAEAVRLGAVESIAVCEAISRSAEADG